MTQRQSPTTPPEPLAYLNGRWIPVSQAAVPVTDGGFVQGVTVAEQLRSFGGKLFRLEQHLDRLERSLAIVGVNPGLRREDFVAIATDLAAQNRKLLDSADDLGLSIFVTPGTYGTFAGTAHRGPTVGMHTYPLPFANWAEKYRTGDRLVVTGVRQVPGECWPSELKCRSRMHYYLADRQAREIDPGARALLLDERGFVSEASTANILVYFKREGLVSPLRERILPGITVAVLAELAEKLGIPFTHRDLTPEDAAGADEVLLCSTSPCVWSVTRLNQKPISDGKPGPIAGQLRDAWNEMVGMDIEEQARRFASRTAQ
jgi:branched-subunit amino acid aminotransferase/4-amino-4-deoxychorismate lyase